MKKKYLVLEILSGFILVLSVVLVFTVVTQISNKGYVQIFGKSMFRVVTGSMEPTIETGALLICDDTDIYDIQINDIVCFESNNSMMRGQVITHRVVDMKEINGVLRLTTKGDANTVEDALYVTENNLIGRVTWYSTDQDLIAKVISFMSGKIGFLACIVIPVLLVCGFALKESMKNIQLELEELRRIEAGLHKKEVVVESQETDEELRARLRAEIRKELGLDDEEQEQKTND